MIGNFSSLLELSYQIFKLFKEEQRRAASCNLTILAGQIYI
jgi:hypothetical protein